MRKTLGRSIRNLAGLCLLSGALALGSGCASVYHQPDRLFAERGIQKNYLKQVKSWEKQGKEKGWSEDLVDDVINELFNYFKAEIDTPKEDKDLRDSWWLPKDAESKFTKGYKYDDWKTYGEIIKGNFIGDCDEKSFLDYKTLKEAGYPHDVRILVVRYWAGYHFYTHVKLPNGTWKKYNTTNDYISGGVMETSIHTNYVEFDDEFNIWKYVDGKPVLYENLPKNKKWFQGKWFKGYSQIRDWQERGFLEKHLGEHNKTKNLFR